MIDVLLQEPQLPPYPTVRINEKYCWTQRSPSSSVQLQPRALSTCQLMLSYQSLEACDDEAHGHLSP